MDTAKKTPKKFEVKIKKEFADERIGFGQSNKPLKDRDDLDDLMDIALNSQSPTIIRVFEKMPTDDEWKDHKSALYLSNNPA